MHEVFLNIKLVRIFSSGAYLGEVKLEKLTIALKYTMDIKRICCNMRAILYHLEYHNLVIMILTKYIDFFLLFNEE